MAHMKFEVPTVSLHVHERIDPLTIIKSVKRKDNDGRQVSLFEYNEENPPLREAIEFYKHKHNWSNRLIAGDSLLVMNSLLQKRYAESANDIHRSAIWYQVLAQIFRLCESNCVEV